MTDGAADSTCELKLLVHIWIKVLQSPVPACCAHEGYPGLRRESLV